MPDATNPRPSVARSARGRFGLGFRLMTVMAVFTALSLIMAAVAWMGYQRISGTYRVFTEESLPQIRVSRDLIDRSVRLVLASPIIQAVTSRAEFESLKSRIESERAVLAQALQEFSERTDWPLETANFEATIATVDRNVDEQLTLASRRVDALEITTRDRSSALAAIAGARLIVRVALVGVRTEDSGSAQLLSELTYLQFHTSNIENVLEQMPQLTTQAGVVAARNQFLRSIRQTARRSFNLPLTERPRFANLIEELLNLANNPERLFNSHLKQLHNLDKLQSLERENARLAGELEQHVATLLTVVNDSTDNSARIVTETVHNAELAMSAIAALAVALSIALSVLWVYPQIVRRLTTVTDRTRRIAAGELSTEIDTSGHDELADMSRALQQFQQDLRIKKHNESKLEEREQRLRSMFESIVVGLVITSRRGVIESFNPASEVLFACTEQQACGESITRFIPDFDLSYGSADDVMNTDTRSITSRFDLRAVTTNGEEFSVECTVSQFLIDGQPRLSIFVEDITERRQNAAEREALVQKLSDTNAELERFAYVASHDLQEPLRMVRSFTNLLLTRYGDRLDEKGRSYLGYASDGAERMQGLIEDLLEYSRLGHDAGQSQEIDLTATASEAVESMRGEIEESAGQVTIDELPVVYTNSLLMSQLLQNLIGNALKYRHPDVSPKVHVDAEREGDFWQISVIDNGIGIAVEHREKVFEAFARLHARSKFGGNGIGLSICRRIVERCGGRIWVDTAPDGGCAFRFTIPYYEPAAIEKVAVNL